MRRKMMTTSWFAMAALVSVVSIGPVFADAGLVRGEIHIDDGPEVSFSIPISLLQALKTSGLTAMVEDKEKLGLLVDSVLAELESMKASDLPILRVRNEGAKADVWVEEAGEDDPMRAGFVFVDIVRSDHEAEVSLRLPQGIFFLGSFMCNQFMETHGDEVFEIIRESLLAKVEAAEHGHSHEPPYPHQETDPIEEMRQHVGHLEEKIDHLRREGRHEEAEGLEREAEKIRRKIEEMEHGHGHELPYPHQETDPIEEMRQHVGHLEEKIDHLRREGRHEEAEGLEREAEGIRRKIEEMERGHSPGNPHHELHHDSEHRTRLLDEAVDNMLKAVQRMHEADMHDRAEQLAREAEKLRTEIRN